MTEKIVFAKMFNPETGKLADVHPDEVENMRASGWRMADQMDRLDLNKEDGFDPEKVELLDDGYPSDEDMRIGIMAITNKRPHGKLGRDKLKAEYDQAYPITSGDDE